MNYVHNTLGDSTRFLAIKQIKIEGERERKMKKEEIEEQEEFRKMI